jgi:hypothetical protein
MTAGGGLLVAGLWVSCLLAGCSLGEPVTCTGIECSNALVVELGGGVPSSYTIEARGNNEIRSYTCTEASLCREAVFTGFTPTQVTIRVTWSGGSAEEVVTPSYEVVQPNGPDCPPTCRLAVVTITLPG